GPADDRASALGIGGTFQDTLRVHLRGCRARQRPAHELRRGGYGGWRCLGRLQTTGRPRSSLRRQGPAPIAHMSTIPIASTPAARPTVRYWLIVVLLFGASLINYVDRQTLSVLKPLVKSVLAIEDTDYALLVNVFTFCYAGAYIATGWLVDRIGPRIALFVFITVWSLATIGCGLANTFLAFAACRAVLGLAEPGNQPATVKALTLWVPTQRRGLMMSVVGGGSTVGSIIAAPLVASLATRFGWHAAFFVPGV